LVRATVPKVASESRITFLAYESIFLVLAVALYWGTKVFSRAREAALFFGVQYALWIASDIVILTTKSDLGYALRLIPDCMYYVLFVPFVLLRASATYEGEKVG
jgi:hypothetical protein